MEVIKLDFQVDIRYSTGCSVVLALFAPQCSMTNGRAEHDAKSAEREGIKKIVENWKRKSKKSVVDEEEEEEARARKVEGK